MTRKRIALHAAALAAFIIVLLSTPFLHVETTLEERTACPACHFQGTAVADGQIVSVALPELILFGWACDLALPSASSAALAHPISRGPPAG